MACIRGQVESLRVIREGWGTLQILSGSAHERTTVTGHPLGIDVGDTVEVTGEWQTHARFGKQLRATAITVIAPSDAAGAIEWICSRLPGIGRKRATAILERWPIPDVWEVLRERPEALGASDGIDGITPARALQIGARYREVEHERARIVALRGYGLTDRQSAQIVEKWGEDAVEKLRSDPYELTSLYGFGFKRADACALKMGLPANHPSRIRAGLAFLLEAARDAGHCYVPAGALIAMTARELGVREAEVVREGREMIADGKLTRREGRGGGKDQRVYLASMDEAEDALARALGRLVDAGGVAGLACAEGEAA